MVSTTHRRIRSNTHQSWCTRALLSLVIVSAAWVGAFSDSAQAADFCAEQVDKAVIVQVARTGIGRGLDQVYPVELRPARVRTSVEAEVYKGFRFYRGLDDFGTQFGDRRSYFFDDDGRGELVLYKHVPGRKAQRVTLYKVELPRSRLTEIRQVVRTNDRTLYTDLGLEGKLEVLGVMGVIFRGGRGTVDFVNSLEVSPPAGGAPKLIVRNADALLYRFAVDQQLEGVSGLIDGTELGMGDAFATVLRKKDEKTLLSGKVPGGTQTYYEAILSGASKPSSHWWPMNTQLWNDSAPGTAMLSAADFSLRYAACVPQGDAQLQAKAVFVPARIDGKYPVIVYPGAFADLDTLRMSLERAYAQGAWWNAVLNLPPDSIEREFLLRLSVPQWLWTAIRSEKVLPGATASRGVEKIMDQNPIGQGLMQTTLDRLSLMLATPDANLGDLPGVPHPALIQPASTQTHIGSAEMAYNQAVHALQYGNSPMLSAAQSKRFREDLIKAIAKGYALQKESRNDSLRSAIVGATSLAFSNEMRGFRGIDFTSLNYIQDDLEWLHGWVTRNRVRLGLADQAPLIIALRTLKERVISMSWGMGKAEDPMPLDAIAARVIAIQRQRSADLATQFLDQVKKPKNLLDQGTDDSNFPNFRFDWTRRHTLNTSSLDDAEAASDISLKAKLIVSAWSGLDEDEKQVTASRDRLKALKMLPKSRPLDYRAIAGTMSRAGYVAAALEDFIDGADAKGDFTRLKMRLIEAGMGVAERVTP